MVRRLSPFRLPPPIWGLSLVLSELVERRLHLGLMTPVRRLSPVRLLSPVWRITPIGRLTPRLLLMSPKWRPAPVRWRSHASGQHLWRSCEGITRREIAAVVHQRRVAQQRGRLACCRFGLFDPDLLWGGWDLTGLLRHLLTANHSQQSPRLLGLAFLFYIKETADQGKN